MISCDSKGAGRSHSGLRGFFPLLPDSAASLFYACAREAGHSDLL
jgi:hypothetical protein